MMNALLAFVFLALPRLAMAQPGTASAGKLSVDQAKRLLPKAASISNADFLALGTDPDPSKIKNQSLSLVLLSRDVWSTGPPDPVKIVNAMAISRRQGYVSLIQPEYITECTCESGEDLAEGTVAFCKKGIFQGKARFVALKQKNEWVITEFHLPNDVVWVFLGQDDGVWHRAIYAVNARAPDPRPTDREFKNQLSRLDSKDAKGLQLQALTWLNRNRAAKNADLAIASLERIVREDPDAEVRRKAVPVLGLIANNLKMPCPLAIVVAFLDKDFGVQEQAMACSGMFNTFAPGSAEISLGRAQSESPNVRCESLRILALAAPKDMRTLDAIEKAKQDPSFQVRHAAYCAQFQANSKLAEFVPYIIRVHEDPQSVLGPLPNDSEIRMREQCMKDLFRTWSATWLIHWSEQRPEELARVLGELLEDKSPLLRRGAARLMGTTAIKTALSNPDQPRAESISEIIKGLQEDGKSKPPLHKSKFAVLFEKLKVEERLRQLRDHDPDPSVREAARTALQQLASVHEQAP